MHHGTFYRLVVGFLLSVLTASPLFAHGEEHPEDETGGKGDLSSAGSGGPQGGPFPAFNVHLLGHLTLPMIGGGGTAVLGNDIWGWTDPVTGSEYAIYGRSNGTSFIDITDPTNPQYLGNLPSHTGNAAWRDMKVYKDHAFIVADNNGAHGMQVFDLTQLRGLDGGSRTFSHTVRFSGFNESHNIAINEDTGYAYAVGTERTAGGLYMININNPIAPVLGGTYSGDGYTHDVQVVTYNGPDATYVGREIAFASNEDTVTVIDVTNKASPAMLSRKTYPNFDYVHQGWLTEDHRYFISNDEGDERRVAGISNTRTHFWNVEDLNNILYIGYYEAGVISIDHNLFIHNNLVFMGNYTSGMRVLDITDIDNLVVDVNGRITNIPEVAWIDTHPSKNVDDSFDGVWSIYPYFSSGSVIINDRQEGLVIVQLNIQPGDVQSDRRVDLDDMLRLAQYWLTPTNHGYMHGDFNHDNIVDLLDLRILEDNWLIGAPGGPSFQEALQIAGLVFPVQEGVVPEPPAAMLVLLALGLLIYRRTRVPA